MDDFKTVAKFDSHVHFNIFDTTFLKQSQADNFHLLTVNVSPYYYPPIEKQLEIATQLIREYPDRISFATTFSVKNFNDKNGNSKPWTI
ncbi:MAG: hypothetical protein H0X70_06060 [Segetibacter sp.]|nr:hypothetical protein [Segetibacter sp.]